MLGLRQVLQSRSHFRGIMFAVSATVSASAFKYKEEKKETMRCDSVGLAGYQQTAALQRQATVQRIETTQCPSNIEDRYHVDDKPLGVGAFGKVYSAVDRKTGEKVAVKEISKHFTNDLTFQNEINALLHIRKHSGHPNICNLREHFSHKGYYYLVLDLVSGGEMFDHLVARGPYSEADAARLIREIASALNFLHGLGVVHGDLKPENLMLSSTDSDAAAIRLVDFGCAHVGERSRPVATAHTPAYSPPEGVSGGLMGLDPSFDQWALGVILHIMLTGVHPFDTEGGATDTEMQMAIFHSKHRNPVQKTLTSHLSREAVDVMESLLQWDPNDRATAYELLRNSWVLGQTARTDKISGSDTRLSKFKSIQPELEAGAFSDMVIFSTKAHEKSSLLHHAFQSFNKAPKGEELKAALNHDTDDSPLSFSGYSALLSENLKNRFYSKGETICKEGEPGESMYFINSGTVQVSSKDGLTNTKLKRGGFFGEGALFEPGHRRNATINCLTPVHLIQVDRHSVEQYVASGGDVVMVHLREIFRSRVRQRANAFLRMQQSSGELTAKQGDLIFKEGDKGSCIYVLQEGRVVTSAKSHTVFTVEPGQIFGEQAVVFGTPRNMTAKCVSNSCKMLTIPDSAFLATLTSEPRFGESFLDICYRREFQKVICLITKTSFPDTELKLRRVFDMLDQNHSGKLEIDNIRAAVKRIDPELLENDVLTLLRALDLCENGLVSWAEFKRIFGMKTAGA